MCRVRRARARKIPASARESERNFRRTFSSLPRVAKKGQQNRASLGDERSILWGTSTLDARIWRSFREIMRRRARASAECVRSFTGWRSSDELRSRETRSTSRRRFQKLVALRALTAWSEDDRGRRDLGDASSNFPRLLDLRKLRSDKLVERLPCMEPEDVSGLDARSSSTGLGTRCGSNVDVQ